MFRILKFLGILSGTYIATVAGIWGFVETYTYFTDDYLKGLLGSYWWLIYGVPLLVAFPLAYIKSFYQTQGGSSLSIDFAENIWDKKVKPVLGLRGRLSNYLKELESKIREMPFIYKGLEGYVENDFVNVEIQSLDFGTLKVKPVFIGAISTNKRLQDTKKIIILGGGGIGKTTFQRHTIIEIINEHRPNILHEKEKVIPVYVPLKAVDNSSSFPILRYIMQNTSFLAHNKDVDTLINLAVARKLFLFLDGYDEIQFAGAGDTSKNFVREELNLMFSFNDSKSQPFLNFDQRYKKFYGSLGYCRIWLSSRKEFFQQHPISVDIVEMYRSSRVWAIELKGIGDNRVKLINIIFDKYRKQSPEYAKLFNAEYFIQEIDDDRESEIHKLSFNPLFMTIMCYIYSQKVVEQKRFDVKWGNSFNELIWECVTLLVHDLDDAKARDLPEAQKTALLRRRNAYQNEKEEFLLYFAKELFHDEQNIFNLTYIKDKVIGFFKNEYKSEEGEKIIRELENDSIGLPNFALQLIFAGIFIIVDRNNNEILYDFPHRRFREVLASKYYIKYGHASLLENLERKSFSELIYVYFAVSSHQDEILELILTNTKNLIGNNYFSGLALNCLNRKPAAYSPNKILSEFFLNCIASNESFSLSVEILNYFQPSRSFITNLEDRFLNYLRTGKAFSFSLCFDLLSRYDENTLRALSLNELAERLEAKDDLSLLIFLKHRNILKWFKENEALHSYLEFILTMKDLFIPVVNKNKSIPFADNGEEQPELCYILTEELIKGMKDNLRRRSIYLDIQTLSILESKQYDVYFSEDFLNDPAIKIDKTLREFLLNRSKVNYKLYSEAMITIKGLNKTLQEINYFIS